MPVARSQRQVRTEALPGVRLQSAKTQTSTGVGAAQAGAAVGEAVERLGNVGVALGATTFGRMMEQERDRADSIALLDAENRISSWKNKRLLDPTTGALAQKGKDAMGLPEKVNDEFIQLTSEIEAGMNDRQKAKFAGVRAQHGTGLDLTLRRHQLEQTNIYEGQELESKIKNSLQSGWANANDPKQIGIDLQSGLDSIKLHLANIGAGPETIEQKTLEFSSAMHSGVIDRLINSGQDRKASAYFAEVKDTGQLTGEALGDLEKQLEEGSLRGESQRKAEEITGDGKKSYDDMMVEVKKISDPKLQDATRERVEHFDTKRDQQKRETEEAMVSNAYTTVERTKDWRSVPIAEWNKLSPQARNMLRSLSEHLTDGTEVKTVFKHYYEIENQVTENPDAFIKRDLLLSAGKLSPSDLKHFSAMQRQMRAGLTKSDEKTFNGLRTNAEIWAGVLNDSGLDKDSDEAHALHRELDRRIDVLQEAKKGAATNTEIQEVADSLVGNVVLTPGSWSSYLPGGAAPQFFDVTKPVRDVTINDIPQNERQAIANMMRAAGRPLTEDAILVTYIQWKRSKGQVKK